MSDPATRRLRRLLLLLPAAARAARAGRGVPVRRAVELTGARSKAELLEDVRAVHDLWALPGQGEDVLDLYVEEDEVHVTYPLSFGDPPAFSLAEGAVLLAALAPFEREAGKPVRDAMRKLRRAVPEPLREEADRLVRGLDLELAPPGRWAPVLRDAIERNLEVTLEYRGVADGEVGARTVEPRVVFAREGHWYLAAWNVAKGEEHLFRLDRVVSVLPGTRAFGPHKGPPLARYGRRSLFFASGAEREVTVRFRGTSARLARERWGDRAREAEDGSVSVPMRVTPGNYLYGLLLGHGGEATVEGPPDVAAQLAARVDELARLYEGPAAP